MYEHRTSRPLPLGRFLRRLARHAAAAATLVAASLVAGMIGYRSLEHLAWTDAFLNAAMLLGGMGPVDAPRTVTGKIFAGLYALYAGLVFLVAAGVVVAPVLHRLMHVFHQDLEHERRR